MMLGNAELLASPTVANAVMNRGRGLTGINSYERELRFDIPAFLEARARTHGAAVWYDVCCGEGRALIEAGQRFHAMGAAVEIIGVDLVDAFADGAGPNVRLIAADAAAFTPDTAPDLVTCVHGLHYLGDKLGVLERLYQQMVPGGLLLAHWDPGNVRETEGATPLWPRLARRAHAPFQFKSHLLTLTRTDAPLDFGMTYQGATVSERPNYTGITVIDSWYRTRG